MIYVIHAVRTKYIKVGVARNPARRLHSLQVSIPFDLVLLAVADWPQEWKTRIHHVLAGTRVRGEWFKRDERLDSLIKHMQDGGAPLEWVNSYSPPSRLHRVLALARA